MKDGVEEIEHEFPFLSVEHSVGKKKDYLLGCFSLGGSRLRIGGNMKKNWLAKQVDFNNRWDRFARRYLSCLSRFFPFTPPGALSQARDVWSFHMGNFPLVRSKKSGSILPSKMIFRKLIVNCKQSTFRV